MIKKVASLLLTSMIFTSVASASTYIVKPGDTLWKISQNNNITFANLLKANSKITDPSKIYVGQTVSIPENWEIKANEIIKTGETFIGITNYQYGAPRYYSNSFRDDRFDCSSFIQYIYYLNGIKLNSNSRLQATNDGYEIGLSDIRKGDLVFFRSYGSSESSTYITHVAMYVGDNKLLHTYGSPGVVYSNFEGTNWEKRVIKVKRVIE